MSNEQLNAEELKLLREKNFVKESEFAYRAGDLIIAENVKSGEKRIVGSAVSLLSETNRRILKG